MPTVEISIVPQLLEVHKRPILEQLQELSKATKKSFFRKCLECLFWTVVVARCTDTAAIKGYVILEHGEHDLSKVSVSVTAGPKEVRTRLMNWIKAHATAQNWEFQEAA